MHKISSGDNITIALVTDTLFDTNGVSRFIGDMLRYSPEYNATLYAIAASRSKAPLPSPNIIRLKPFIAIPMPFYKEQSLQITPPFLSLFRAIRRVDPDIIHISTPGPLGWSALLIAKILNIPVASTYHTDFPAFLEENTGFRVAGRITAWFMRRFYRRMSFTFARSKQYIQTIQSEVGVDKERIIFLNPGTDTKSFNPSFKKKSIWTRYDIDQDATVLLYVGRLNIEKNLLFLIDRYRELKQESNQNIVLVLVGEGEYTKYADGWRQEGIYYLGIKRGEELSRIYASSDIFVSPSTTETLGQTVMEAQASGACAVVSDQGGVVESVEDGISGYTLSIDRPKDWVSRLKILVADKTKRASMGKAGYEHMQQHSIQASCEAFIEEHRGVMRVAQ